jgi:SAM-dependent methyltransferase
MVAILSDKREFILQAVKDMYSDVALNPEKTFHFPTGRAACLFVGYPETELDAIPATAVESFAGVGYPFGAGVVRKGDVVLDIGSGSGTDVLIASRIVGSAGKVYGLDMTSAMLEKLGTNARKMNAANVVPLRGEAEAIPLDDGAVDVVTSNGVLNLVPDKAKAFAEISRILKPGGRVQIADIVVGRPISEQSRNNPQLWAECIVGAFLEDSYIALIKAAGFAEPTLLRRFDYFSGSANDATRRAAASFEACTIEIATSKA